MKIFVTGATGFLGSYVVRRFIADQQTEVAILVRPTSDLWRIDDVVEHIRVYTGHLDDREQLEGALSDFRPVTVIHLAWEGVINKSRNDLTQYRNVCTSARLIEASIACGVETWVGLGSQAEYGPCSKRVDENTPTRPTTLYDAAKLSTCILAEKLCEIGGLRFAWLRLFSAFGPKDHPDWLIPYMILALLQGERPAVTKAEQLWDYLYIEDAADAVVRVARHAEATGIFNLGSGQAQRLRDIIEQIRDMIDPNLAVGFGEVPYRPDQVMHLEANIDRLSQLTGWQPVTPLEEGLRRTIDWYRHGYRH